MLSLDGIELWSFNKKTKYLVMWPRQQEFYQWTDFFGFRLIVIVSLHLLKEFIGHAHLQLVKHKYILLPRLYVMDIYSNNDNVYFI